VATLSLSVDLDWDSIGEEANIKEYLEAPLVPKW
jgi:hypothetical protein